MEASSPGGPQERNEPENQAKEQVQSSSAHSGDVPELCRGWSKAAKLQAFARRLSAHGDGEEVGKQ